MLGYMNEEALHITKERGLVHVLVTIQTTDMDERRDFRQLSSGSRDPRDCDGDTLLVKAMTLPALSAIPVRTLVSTRTTSPRKSRRPNFFSIGVEVNPRPAANIRWRAPNNNICSAAA